jgi:hypothetical protein
MSSLIAQRDQVEADLVILHDRDADYTLPNYDAEYLRLTTQLHDSNRTLYTIYARYLDRPSRPYPEPEETSSNMAMTFVSPTDDTPCPYQHISTLPPHPATTPHMTLITLNDFTAQALFARAVTSSMEVTALADSGASHILLQTGMVTPRLRN